MKKENQVVIAAPKFRTAVIEIRGTSPYMQARFSQKAKEAMMATMAAGSTAKTKKKREARNFEEDFKQAQHISGEGWNGIPAAAFRNACIDACRMVGYTMTAAKMTIFVEADGFDKIDGIPLVKIIGGPPEKTEMAVRVQRTNDIRVRPMWREWSAVLRIRFDEDQFTLSDVVNLVARAGMQVGVGEGRPFGRESYGMGFGLFEIVSNQK